jgi:hypothetical protein
MSTHTPGPWNLVSQRANAASGSPVVSEIWGGNYIVARLGALHTDRAVTDARLIAAAPELLDLARNVAGLDVRYLSQSNLPTLVLAAIREWQEAARAAIAKAEGTCPSS